MRKVDSRMDKIPPPRIITFQDLLLDPQFRQYVCTRVTESIGKSYEAPVCFPKLYRYRSLTEYAVNDLVNGIVTASSIGGFNDVFDGAFHQYGSKEEIERAAESEWERLDDLRKKALLPSDLLKKEDIIDPLISHYRTDSRLKFRELEYLGTYVSCFSEDNKSTLMWSHYADSNTGFCVEYDFNQLSQNDLYKNSVFPVVYTQKPIDVGNLLGKDARKIYEYPLDAAVLCSAINKSLVWSYEREWRFVWVWTIAKEDDRYLPITPEVSPTKIYLGYHFLKPFFYYGKSEDIEKRKRALQLFFTMLEWILINKIPVEIMIPSIGNYILEPHKISGESLFSFMKKEFRDCEPNSMRYYYTVHDSLMDLISFP